VFNPKQEQNGSTKCPQYSKNIFGARDGHFQKFLKLEFCQTCPSAQRYPTEFRLKTTTYAGTNNRKED
jgi:hypothetical protein